MTVSVKLRKAASTILKFWFVLQLILLFSLSQRVMAQIGAVGQGFGIRNVANVRGTRVLINTGNPPGTSLPGTYNVGLTGICANYPCVPGSYLWETGWYKGLSGLNQHRHYVSWVGPIGSDYRINLAVLNANTYYEFQTLFSNTTYSWEAWRDGIPRFQLFLGEAFKKGNYVSCGLETGILSGSPWPNFSNHCKNMRYKLVGGTNWIQYDYTGSQIFGPYCITRFVNYEVHSWKCS